MSQLGYYPIDMTSLAAPGTPVGGVVAGDDPMAGWLRRDVAGMPVWGWLVGVGVVGAGLVALSQMQERKLAEGTPQLEANASSAGPWSPSRTGVSSELSEWLRANGNSACTVIADADEASKVHRIKNPSPLINVKVNPGSKLEENAAFKQLLATHGLEPVRVEENVVGLVPNKGTPRASEWESYIDALREEGQSV